MDISPIAVPLADQPFAPWLRLAHVSGVNDPRSVSHEAFLRTILDFEFVLQLSGWCWIYCADAGGSVDIHAGELAFIPPHFGHGWASEPGQHIAVHFDLHARPTLGTQATLQYTRKRVTRRPIENMPRFALTGLERIPIPLVTRLRAPALWREKLEALTLLYSRRAHQTVDAQFLVAESIGWAMRTLLDDARHAAGGGHSENGGDARILSLLRELETAPADRQSISELAARAHMGLTAFRDNFHRVTGRSPRAYLEERRIERAARRLIETDRRILEIAEAEGFDDPYHFSRVFKRVMGAAPRAYRERGRK